MFKKIYVCGTCLLIAVPYRSLLLVPLSFLVVPYTLAARSFSFLIPLLLVPLSFLVVPYTLAASSSILVLKFI